MGVKTGSIKRNFPSLLFQKISTLLVIVVSTSRHSNSVVVLLIGTSAFLAAIQFNHVLIGTFFDDAHYVILAESLASGQGFRRINEPSMPVEPDFPPGWPLLLVPVVSLFPGSFTALKLLTYVLWLGTIPLCYRLFIRRFPSHLALITVALTAFNPFLIRLATSTLSEPAFLFFTILSLNLFEDWRQTTQKNRPNWLIVAAFICTTYAALIRTVGITLLAAMLLYLFIKASQRFKVVLSGIVLGVMLLLTGLNSLGYELSFLSVNYTKHLTYITSSIGSLIQFWKHYPVFTSDLDRIVAHIVPVFDLRTFNVLVHSTISFWFCIGLITITLYGFFLTVRRYQLTELYVILFLGIFYVWTIYIGKVQPRQLFPILPFLYFYLVKAFDWLRRHMVKYQVNSVQLAYILPTLLILVSIGRDIHEWRRPIYDRTPNLWIGATWLRENTPPDTIFMAANVPGVYLYARRQTVYPGYRSADQDAYIRSNKVDYVLVQPHILYWDNDNKLDDYTTERLLPTLEAHPDKYKIVYRNSAHNVTIYKVITDEETKNQ